MGYRAHYIQLLVDVAVVVLNFNNLLVPVSQNLTRLYLDKATLVWNGNAVSGQDALGEFFESLPSSEFQVHTLDCQPVHGQWGNLKTYPSATGDSQMCFFEQKTV